MRVLMVEDDVRMAGLVRRGLEEDGHAADMASTGEDAVWMAQAHPYDAIVLDVMLPGLSGFETCKRLRNAGVWSPVLMLTARDGVDDRVAGLDAGADDYLTKPFSTIEFMARARAQLRRAQTGATPNDSIVSIGDLTVDLQRRRVERAGTLLHLTPTEWLLLRTFVTHPRQTLTHRQLFRAVWGNASGDAQQYLRVYVGHLRRKIEADPVRPRYIQTEAGVGYRFEPASEPRSPPAPVASET
jgi:DNA-binding response OmpR family regulator